MASAGDEQQAVMKAYNDRKLEIQRVAGFFGQETVLAQSASRPTHPVPSGDLKAKLINCRQRMSVSRLLNLWKGFGVIVDLGCRERTIHGDRVRERDQLDD